MEPNHDELIQHWLQGRTTQFREGISWLDGGKMPAFLLTAWHSLQDYQFRDMLEYIVIHTA